LRYVLASSEMRRVLGRAAAFFLFGSAYWALLPLIAKETLGGNAALYGILLTAIGAGAVVGALLLSWISARASSGLVVTGSTLITAASMAALALVPNPLVAATALFFAGSGWVAALTTLNVAAQTALPNWVRARGLALYITVFFGAMTMGSLAWGQIAQALAIPTALLIAAGGAVLSGLLVSLVKLPEGDADLIPALARASDRFRPSRRAWSSAYPN
jgi:predicted MFS family arabinose efflux permease